MKVARKGAETRRAWEAFCCYCFLLGWLLALWVLAPLALLYAGLKHVANEAHCLLSRRAQRRRVLISTREVGNGC